MTADFVDVLVADQPAGAGPVLRLLGDVRVSHGTRWYEVPEGSKRLLVYVALHRRRLDRGHAAATLWPDAPDSRAAGNLRSALWRLNQARVGLIGVDRHHLAFRPGVLVDIDLVTAWAGRLIAGRPAGADLTALPTGGILFDLLPGWYDDWVLTERERVRQRVLHGMEAMSRHLVTTGRCAEAVEVALTAAGAEPLRESAQRVLLEAHLAEGNWVEGRRGLDTYRRLLARELDMEPDPRLAELLDAYPRARPAATADRQRASSINAMS
ncbi:BTAD domain-containing putative transcriptional regulator [Micromonospora chersina]|uniref:AfsR/SARP family transcriptional regulator n=1 Tax=Micromonospora chersina TaxID=47854 RepID=UPI003452F936